MQAHNIRHSVPEGCRLFRTEYRVKWPRCKKDAHQNHKTYSPINSDKAIKRRRVEVP